MKNIYNKCAALLLCTIALLFSCEKGEDGVPGKNGSANVESRTFSISSSSSWKYSSPHHYLDLSVPELTEANINSSGVMVYFSTTDNKTWIAIPYTQYASPSNYYMGFVSSVGNVKITWFYDSALSSGSNPNTYYGTKVFYKVVVVPPASKVLNPDLDYTNYSEVSNAFNLKD